MARTICGIAAVLLAAGLLPAVALAQSSPAQDTEEVLQRRLDETDMLARARSEAGRIQTQAASTAPRIELAPNDALGERIKTEALDAEVGRRMMEAVRQAELDRLSERLRQRREARGEVLSPAQVDMEQTPAGAAPADAPAIALKGQSQADMASSAPAFRNATIILAMAPGHTGIRRHNPTADPILCSAHVCWISRGADADARAIRRSGALGFFNTLGDRAGACSGRTVCVFRNVVMSGDGALIQPVDLRLLRHDRRMPIAFNPDATCRLTPAGLTCGLGLNGPDYRLWIINETTAAEAGAKALEAFAAARRLPPSQSAGIESTRPR